VGLSGAEGVLIRMKEASLDVLGKTFEFSNMLRNV
jgi:hypothetical protein